MGGVILLLFLAGIAWYINNKSDLRSLREGEILLQGRVARGPGGDCWILNANNGLRYNFYGVNLGKLRTVGVVVKVIAQPETDKVAECDFGRMITIAEYKILETPKYDDR